MKVENIALFKRFLKSEGANTLYAGMYRQYHGKDDPDDVEEYLRQCDAADAILGAFRFPEAGKSFGVDYWFEKAVKWEKIMRSATESKFYGYCRHNQYQIEEEAKVPLSNIKAYLHPFSDYEKKEEEDEAQRALRQKSYTFAQDTQKAKERETQKLDAWTGKTFTKETPKPEPVVKKGVTEEQMALSGFTLFEVSDGTTRRLSSDAISLNVRNGYRICINGTTSEEIKKAKCPFMHVFSKEGALYFLFDNNNINGVCWRMSDKNVIISNKSLVEKILEFFNLKIAYTQLRISKNMAKTDKNLFYKITKVKK